MPEMGSAGDGKEPCLVNHRVQTPVGLLKGGDPGLEEPHAEQCRGRRA